jgi:Chaperone of endosialidase
MKSVIRLKQSRSLPGLLIPLLVACLSLFPTAQAVVPAPDGGYSGFNTAEGQNALFSRTSGVWNTAVGGYSLFKDTTGGANTAVGLNTLRQNVDGTSNTAAGLNALYSNINGWYNNAVGAYALANNISGNSNTANGYGALYHSTEGNDNTAIGFGALYLNTTAFGNTAMGSLALNLNTGNANTAIGYQTLLRNTTGIANTAIGRGALGFSTGDSNTALGYSAGSAVTTGSNVICIGANVAGADVSDSCYIGNIFNRTSSNGVAVLVDADNKLGTTTSSKRFKEEIKPMDKGSEAIMALKPVTFRYKKNIDPTRTSQFGLVAEDVEKVNPALVVRDKEGRPYSVRYDQVNAMLLNEFLKEHRKVQELEKGMAGLTAQLKEQAAQIQKVSAQLQLNKPPTEVVFNSP